MCTECFNIKNLNFPHRAFLIVSFDSNKQQSFTLIMLTCWLVGAMFSVRQKINFEFQPSED
jgi:hypothetical protein